MTQTSVGLALVASYDKVLVALSVVIAIMAAYAALDFARRVTHTRGTARAAWLIGGAIAMGFGIWSMHYMGMLAAHLPVAVQYDWPTVALSLVSAVAASAIALIMVSGPRMGWGRALLGSLMMGGGIDDHALHRHGRDADAGDVSLLLTPQSRSLWCWQWSSPWLRYGSLFNCEATQRSSAGRSRSVRWLWDWRFP